MEAFLFTQLVLSGVCLLGVLVRLGRHQYPRTVTRTAADDVGSLVILLIMAAWEAHLFLGLP